MNECRLFLGVLAAVIITAFVQAGSGEQPLVLMENFNQGLDEAWRTKRLHKRENRFSIVDENKNRVLKVRSNSSASGIFRKWKIDRLKSGTISWVWKVDKSLIENTGERTKKGDDYAARVFLLFEPHFFSWRTPNVCYVWAGNEPVGSIFKSPYSKSVCTIVLQTGNDNLGQWIEQQRDLVADYVRCFGTPPEQLSAVAIMADTDNTGGQTIAWFDNLKITATTR